MKYSGLQTLVLLSIDSAHILIKQVFLNLHFHTHTLTYDYGFCKTCENYQKVGFISKHRESLDNLLLTLKTYPSEDAHRAIHDL